MVAIDIHILLYNLNCMLKVELKIEMLKGCILYGFRLLIDYIVLNRYEKNMFKPPLSFLATCNQMFFDDYS